ncbi:MAG: hypothetical protein KA327_04725 [Pseudarcicella sp.]|nr:hypothetical protein [Pseudarcicella sp.]
MARTGSQGLLDVAITPGNKFIEPLHNIKSKLDYEGILKNEISNIMKSKNKDFTFIDEKVDLASYGEFETTNSDKKYAKTDFFPLRLARKDLNELLVVKVKYGILVSYYGFIEIGKEGYVNIATEVIDLNDNSLLQKNQHQLNSPIHGNWKEGDADFDNLKVSIQESIDKSITILKESF